MRHFLSRNSLRWHFGVALVSAVVARALCAFFVYGPQALDDYKHGVWPAYQHFAGQTLDLPDYRSHLLVWILSAFIRVGSWFGVSTALTQVRVMYFGLAALSLLGLLGTYLFVRGFRSRLFPALALYLVAVYPLMPFVSTRAFGEAIAMSFVLLGFGVLEDARRASRRGVIRWCLGFLFLGVAVLFRFHVGLLFVSYALVLLYLRIMPGVMGAFFAGLLTLAMQLAVDVLSGKAPLGTLLSYLAANEGGAAQYGVSPWYNTWLFMLALTLPPFSFVLWSRVRGLWLKHWPWLGPVLLYVLAHSLVPHKEERFLYPVIGVELWALAWLWSAGAFLRWARTLYTRVFLGLSVPLLFLVCLVNTQEGEIEPAAYAESRYGAVTYLDQESLFGLSRVQFYFLRPPSVLAKVGPESFNANAIDEALQRNPSHRAVVLLTSVARTRDQLHALEGVRTVDAQCLNMRAAGSLIDQLIYGLNPAHNQRRRPTWYLICERS
jgi:Alg9-like mannosyltransferase family